MIIPQPQVTIQWNIFLMVLNVYHSIDFGSESARAVAADGGWITLKGSLKVKIFKFNRVS